MAHPKALPGTGTLLWDPTKKLWKGRITLVDGARPWILVRDLPNNDRGRERAREVVEEKAQIARKEGLRAEDFGMRPRGPKKPDAAAPAGESCDAYFGRLMDAAKAGGQTDVEKKRSRWKKWVSPTLGPKPIASVTTEDVEDVRDKLDRAIEEWKRDRERRRRRSGPRSPGRPR